VGTVEAEDKYSGELVASLAPSRLARAFVAVASAATLALLLATPLPLRATLLAVTALACLALDALRRAAAAPRIVLDREGAIAVGGRAGTVSAGSFVAPWLVLLRWRAAGARCDRTLLVAPDMLPPNDFRALRVTLGVHPRWPVRGGKNAHRVY
jgi:hypothetical protein